MATELSELTTIGAKEGWDGYGANPINMQSFNHAMALLGAKPLELPDPDWGLMPSGCVSFEYYKTPTHIFTGCVSEQGVCSFAYTEGDTVLTGRFDTPQVFWEFMPTFLSRLFDKY